MDFTLVSGKLHLVNATRKRRVLVKRIKSVLFIKSFYKELCLAVIRVSYVGIRKNCVLFIDANNIAFFNMTCFNLRILEIMNCVEKVV